MTTPQTRLQRKRKLSEEDVLNILHLIHQEEHTTWSVALGYPLTAKEVYDIALGRNYRIEGHPYPEKLTDHRTPEQIARSVALPGKIVEFAKENEVSLTRLWFVVGRLKNEQRGKERATRAVRAPKKLVRDKGVNEMLLFDAFNELCTNPELGVATYALVERAIALKGEPDNARARANMGTNFRRAITSLVRANHFLVDGGMVTMFEIGAPEQPADLA